MASQLGVRDDAGFEEAYWEAFEEFFGRQNSKMLKSMLLARYPEADTGDGVIDRVCYGIRETMGWVAEAIERNALQLCGIKAK